MTRTIGVVAAMVALLVSGVARADAEQVAAECIEAIHETMGRAVEAMRTVSENGVTRIQHLDDQGAPDHVLRHAAHEAVLRIRTIADSSTAHVGRLVRGCVRQLEDLDAPPLLIHRVREVGANARERIATVERNTSQRVHRALHEALASD